MSASSIRIAGEALEARECPTATALFRGTLYVGGTGGPDTITVTRQGSWVVAGGQWFAAAAVQRLVISGGSGDDVIVNDTDLPAVIYGGAGHDTVHGGRGRDVIYGGHGNDTIYGGPGDDVIYGGSGRNLIDGGPGNNFIVNGSPRLSVANSSLEAQIIQLVNDYRVSMGLAPLRVSQQLNAAAALHSQNMAAVSNVAGPWQAMRHELPGTAQPTPTDRLDAAGYDNWSTAFAWGENIAFGYTTAADVVRAWINSPSHRQNILNPNFTETGLGIRTDRSGTLFFTQTFGNRR